MTRRSDAIDKPPPTLFTIGHSPRPLEEFASVLRAHNMIDILGKAVEGVEKPRPERFIATVDLDRTLVQKTSTSRR